MALPLLKDCTFSRGRQQHANVVINAGCQVVAQVLRIDTAGRTRRIYVKRRDLLRANGLQPRDLRRIDPSQSLTKTSPSITVKENVMLTNLGGVRCSCRPCMHAACCGIVHKFVMAKGARMQYGTQGEQGAVMPCIRA